MGKPRQNYELLWDSSGLWDFYLFAFASLKVLQSAGNIILPWLIPYLPLPTEPPKILQTFGCNCGGTSGVPVVTKAFQVPMSTSTLVAIDEMLWANWLLELIFACILIVAARKNDVALMIVWTVVACINTLVELSLPLVAPVSTCIVVAFAASVLLMNGFGIWTVWKRIRKIRKLERAGRKVADVEEEEPMLPLRCKSAVIITEEKDRTVLIC